MINFITHYAPWMLMSCLFSGVLFSMSMCIENKKILRVVFSITISFVLVIILYNKSTSIKGQQTLDTNSVWISLSDSVNEATYKHCDVEYLPTSKMYFPRYKGEYIVHLKTMNTYYTKGDVGQCVYGKTKLEALKKLQMFLEYKGVGTRVMSIMDIIKEGR